VLTGSGAGAGSMVTVATKELELLLKRSMELDSLRIAALIVGGDRSAGTGGVTAGSAAAAGAAGDTTAGTAGTAAAGTTTGSASAGTASNAAAGTAGGAAVGVASHSLGPQAEESLLIHLPSSPAFVPLPVPVPMGRDGVVDAQVEKLKGGHAEAVAEMEEAMRQVDAYKEERQQLRATNDDEAQKALLDTIVGLMTDKVHL
jgi:hypothetical protein